MTPSNENRVIGLSAIGVVIGVYVLINALEGSNTRILLAGLGALVFLSMLVFFLCKKYQVF